MKSVKHVTHRSTTVNSTPFDVSPFQLLQHRSRNEVSFVNRTWNEYKNGFGNASGDYWVGLKHIHAMTAHSPKYLVARLFYRSFPYAKPMVLSAGYRRFAVHDEYTSYQLHVAGYDPRNSELGALS